MTSSHFLPDENNYPTEEINGDDSKAINFDFENSNTIPSSLDTFY
jgi:hypothetical protein